MNNENELNKKETLNEYIKRYAGCTDDWPEWKKNGFIRVEIAKENKNGNRKK